MKTQFLLFISILLITLASCETLKYPVNGELSQISECKGSEAFNVKGAVSRAPIDDSLSCVQYIYDDTEETLMLTHNNAGFNCCPGTITCIITQKNDTLEIKEQEESALCNCNCLYDLIYTLNNVPRGTYVIKFIEPYAGDMDKLIFSIDLSELKKGEFCVTRKQYPWNVFQE